MFRCHRSGIVPPDCVLGLSVTDDELVIGRTPRMNARLGAKSASAGEMPLAVFNSNFNQWCCAQVVLDRSSSR